MAYSSAPPPSSEFSQERSHPLEPEWDQFLHSLAYIGPEIPPPVPEKSCRIVFSDTVTAEFREQKPGAEFSMSLDSLETYLHRVGFTNTDYTFLPAQTIQREMNARGQPLLTLGVRGQTRYPVNEAQVWGINLMNYLQAPALFTLLKLAHIPALRTARGPEHPLIVLGGHIWPNPLPLASFYDVMVVGDGEPVLAHIAALTPQFRTDRPGLLAAIAEIPGTYVPGYSQPPLVRSEIAFHEPEYAAGSSYLLNGVGALVISRGCPYDCAFCNSSFVSGEYRTKPYSQVLAQIDRFKQNGAKKIMLVAASASNYRSEGKTVDDILAYLQQQNLAIRTMSDRPEHFTSAYLHEASQEKGKIILAPETSPHLRREVLRKTLHETTLHRAIRQIIDAQINYIQLYIIICIPPIRPGVVDFLPDGHPGETEDDLRYLAGLGISIVDQMRQAGLPQPSQKPYVKMDCMPFVPAIGTRLQKLAFASYPAYQQRLVQLRQMIPSAYREWVQISPAMSETTHVLQAFMERNTARAGEVLWETWRKAPSGVVTASLLQEAIIRAGFDLDQIREEYFHKPLPYEALFTECACPAKVETGLHNYVLEVSLG